MQRLHPDIAKNVGLIIRYNREEKGISQEALARKVGITRTYMNLIENQKRVPSFLLFKEIAYRLGKTTTEMGLEALLADFLCHNRLLVLRAWRLIKKLIISGDKEKQQKVANFMESLLVPESS